MTKIWFLPRVCSSNNRHRNDHISEWHANFGENW